jgi:hypothetical protein
VTQAYLAIADRWIDVRVVELLESGHARVFVRNGRAPIELVVPVFCLRETRETNDALEYPGLKKVAANDVAADAA